MNRYSLSHLSGTALRNVLHDRGVTVRFSDTDFIAAIAEFDTRKDYLPAGYPSMKSYCIHELGLPEESAAKRIRVARAAREFPAIFDALADGRLHQSAVVLLAPHLVLETASDLIAAAAHRSKSEIEKLLRERFARIDVPNLQAQVVVNALSEQSPGTVESLIDVTEQSPGTVASAFAQHAPGNVTTPSRTPMRLMIEDDALRSARELLAHQFPSGNDSDIVNQALRELVETRHKRKFGAPSKRRARRETQSHPRSIPAHIRHAAYERDGGRCTFMSEAGRRCPATSRLEYDHVQEVARGGNATAANLRIRCRAHNQYTAELTYGAEFMRNKREEARSAAGRERACVSAQGASASTSARVPPPRSPIPADMELDLVAALRTLGFRAEAIRRALRHCESVPCSTLEDRVRAALTFLRPRARTEDFRPIEQRSSAA